MQTTETIVLRALARGIAPDPDVVPSDWVPEHLVLIDGPYAGQRANLDLTPFWREPLDCLAADSPYEEVVVRKSAQVGYTVMLVLGWFGVIVDAQAAAVMLVLPTILAALQFNREKLTETIRQSPRLKLKVEDQRSRSAEGSTTLFKRFPGGFLVVTGANSSSDLSSKTVKYAVGDEIDRWTLDVERQGDPLEMLRARQISFRATGDAKLLLGSTPTIEGASRIDERYEAGDQRVYKVQCPECQAFHTLDFELLVYDREFPHNARHQCPHCPAQVPHAKKREMLAAGHWEAQQPGPGRPASFHIDALYSPFVTWDDVVAESLAAADDPEKMKTFTNLWLGRSFKVQGEAPEAERLYERRAEYAAWTLPPGVLVLTAGVDVHAERLEIEVVGWGVGRTSWSIGYAVLEGDTDKPEIWAQLTEFVAQSWPDHAGNRRSVEMTAVDAGYRPTVVYDWVRRRPAAMAIKGVAGHLAPVMGTPSKQDLGAKGKKLRGSVLLWPVGTWSLKAELYGFLHLVGPTETGWPPGWCHFPKDYDLEHFRRLTSERLVERQTRGFVVREWHKDPRLRNEQLDCRVYAMAAAAQLRLWQMTAQQWADLAARRGAPAESAQMDLLRSVVAPASRAEKDGATLPAHRNMPPKRPAPRRGGFVGRYRQ